MENYINDIAKIEKIDRYNAIIRVLKENGINYKIQNIPKVDTLGNIIVEFNSSKLKKIVVSAHYDNVFGTPGANDNATACSILLNLILKNKDTNEHIEFVFFDLEERGFIGSEYYVKKNKNNIIYAINLDMCGLGNNIVYSLNKNNEDSLDKIAIKYNAFRVKSLPPGDANSFISENIETFYIINSTTHDLKWFKDFANKRCSNITPDFLETMHKPTDTIDKINIEQVNKIYLFLNELLNKLIFELEMYNTIQSLVNKISFNTNKFYKE